MSDLRASAVLFDFDGTLAKYKSHLALYVQAARESGVEITESALDLALDAGAEDVVADEEGGFEVRTEPSALMQVHKALEGKVPVGAPRMVFLPKTTVPLEGDEAEKVLRLIEALGENDDVQHVYANFEVDDGTMAQLESRA